MKKITFIATIALGIMLTSCSADNEETNYEKPQQAKQFDTSDMNARENDTVGAGEPVKPIKRD